MRGFLRVIIYENIYLGVLQIVDAVVKIKIFQLLHIADCFYTFFSYLFALFSGGSEPRLVKAATEQLNKLPFYHSFWNRTTKPSLVHTLISQYPP